MLAAVVVDHERRSVLIHGSPTTVVDRRAVCSGCAQNGGRLKVGFADHYLGGQTVYALFLRWLFAVCAGKDVPRGVEGPIGGKLKRSTRPFRIVASIVGFQ